MPAAWVGAKATTCEGTKRCLTAAVRARPRRVAAPRYAEKRRPRLGRASRAAYYQSPSGHLAMQQCTRVRASSGGLHAPFGGYNVASAVGRRHAPACGLPPGTAAIDSDTLLVYAYTL